MGVTSPELTHAGILPLRKKELSMLARKGLDVGQTFPLSPVSDGSQWGPEQT